MNKYFTIKAESYLRLFELSITTHPVILPPPSLLKDELLEYK